MVHLWLAVKVFGMQMLSGFASCSILIVSQPVSSRSHSSVTFTWINLICKFQRYQGIQEAGGDSALDSTRHAVESYQFNTDEDIVQLNWSCNSCEYRSCNILRIIATLFSLVNILRIKAPKPPHHLPLWRLWGWAGIRLQIWFWGFDAGIRRCQFSIVFTF